MRTYGVHYHEFRATCGTLQDKNKPFSGLSDTGELMAIYHASIKSFSRGKGESSVAAAAYRAGIDLVCTTSHALHRYSHRHGVASYQMLAPKGAPAWCLDAHVFWDLNEAHERRANSRLARELEVSLPNELGEREREDLAIALGRMLVKRYQVAVLVAIHKPDKEGDQRNHHTHLLMSARQVGPDGLGKRAGEAFDARGGKGAEEIREVRAIVSRMINEHLAAAGIDATVDHRSLKDQATAARARGDLEAAAELSRPPTKHLGQAITAMLRRGAFDPLTKQASGEAEKAMDDAIAKAIREGKLVETSIGHSRESAFLDHIGELEKTQHQPEKSAQAPKVTPATLPLVRGRPVSVWSPSAAGLHLSRLGRLGRMRGVGAELLNAEAELIEQWLQAQLEAAKAALESLQAVGIQMQKPLLDAVASLNRPRVAVYGTKDFLFEDTEELTASIVEFAAALCEPSQMRDRVQRARVFLSGLEASGAGSRSAEMVSARRALTRAKANVSSPARRSSDLRIREAQKNMDELRERFEDRFYVSSYGSTYSSADPPFPEMTREQGGGDRKSDSNRQELRPNLKPLSSRPRI